MQKAVLPFLLLERPTGATPREMPFQKRVFVVEGEFRTKSQKTTADGKTLFCLSTELSSHVNSFFPIGANAHFFFLSFISTKFVFVVNEFINTNTLTAGVTLT